MIAPTAMHEKTHLSIHAAAMNGLARCIESETPLVCLSEFLEKLAELAWHKDDVAAVKNLILKLMLSMARQGQADAFDSTLEAI